MSVIAFTAMSFLWSESSALAIRRIIALVGTSFFGLYLASRYTFKEQLRLLGWVMGIIIVLSVVFVVALPKFGIATGNHAGAWRGIFTHKNYLGDRMAISGLTFLVLALDAKRYRWLLWCTLCSSVILMVLSQSVGAILSFVVPLAAFPFYRSLRWGYRILIPFVIIVFLFVVCSTGWMWFHFDAVLISLGKDPSLTGRTEIWSLVIDSIQRNPWHGYGYQTFWQGLEGESAYVWRAMGMEEGGFRVPHAHNGILQLWLDIGLWGVVIFLLGFWNCIIKSLYWIRNSQGNCYYWPMLYLTYMLITNVSESRLLSYNTLSFALYFSMALTLNQPLEIAATSKPYVGVRNKISVNGT
ncbi:MAG: O-antigen ligase [Waterburya sp.]